MGSANPLARICDRVEEYLDEKFITYRRMLPTLSGYPKNAMHYAQRISLLEFPSFEFLDKVVVPTVERMVGNYNDKITMYYNYHYSMPEPSLVFVIAEKDTE